MSNYNVYPHSCHFLRESTKKLQNYIFHKKFQKKYNLSEESIKNIHILMKV